MSVIIGSARLDERGKISGGTAGDQKQGPSPDNRGEVSMQAFYIHSKGWLVLRPKSASHAIAIAANMKAACNNPHIGYDQGGRYGVIKYGVNARTDTEADCSSLVRECIKEATGKDPGDFTTATEASMLEKSGLFEDRRTYVGSMTLYTGDVLVTKTKGHTVIVTDGAPRTVKPSSLNKTEMWKGKVTASELNVRSWAGTENSLCSFSPLKNGAEVSVCDTIPARDGTEWHYIKYSGKYGFVSAKHIARV